jgi:hypothetical protein
MERLREHVDPQFDKKYGLQLVPYLEKYLQDSDPAVRLGAQSYIMHTGLKSSDQKERQKVVEIILQCRKDDRYDPVSSDLLSFNTSDFSEKAKEILHNQLGKNPKNKTLLLVIGVADMRSELDTLKKIADSASKPKNREREDEGTISRKKFSSYAFAALQARARMGVKEDIQKCIDLVEACPDEEFRVNGLLERLSYVRQPEVVEYIRKYYMMDKVEPSGGSDYADLAGEALSLMLRDFPKYKQEGKPTSRTVQQQIEAKQVLLEKNRGWIKQQTHWDIIR